MSHPPNSDWGDLSPLAVDKIKRHVEQSVEAGIVRAAHSPAVRDGVAEAMAQGLARALERDEVWDMASRRAAESLRQQAKASAGGMVLEGLKSLAKIAAVLLIVYSIAGLPGVAAVWKTITPTE